MRISLSIIRASLLRIAISQSKRLLHWLSRITPNSSPRRAEEVEQRNRARPGKGYKWLTHDEAVLLEVIGSLIVPSDETTPGANEMEVLGSSVSKVIDAQVSASSESQSSYSEGLVILDELAKSIHKAKFIDITIHQQLNILKFLDRNARIHSDRKSLRNRILEFLKLLQAAWKGTFPAIEFFSQLRRDVIAAFYTSEVSWIWLDYDGPPMPHGYDDLLVKRPRKEDSGSKNLKELAASGFGISIPSIKITKDFPDIVVIGSGAGGAVIAKELGEAGLSVVVLEAGRRFNPFNDYLTDRVDFEMVAGSAFYDPANDLRDLYTVSSPDGFWYDRAKGVGGSTLKYMGCSPRFHESDFRVRSEDGLAQDWPISYDDLEPFYTRVEYELGVSGPSGSEANPFDPPRSRPYPTPPHKFNLASLAIKRGADKLGLHLVREPLAIPTVEWDDRPACVSAGTCNLGCASTAKSSMDVTYIRKAEKTGCVEIRTNCMACRITMAPDGKARGVVYIDSEGREQEILARVIVLAANAVESPRLLLMSASSRYPQGLANSSGLVGKYFMEHLAVSAFALFSERLDPWRGTPTGGFMQDNYATSKNNTFARGWTTYVYTSENWPLSIAQKVSGWGVEHKLRTKQLFAHHVGLVTVAEQIPEVRNQVTLDSHIKDVYGLPVPCLTYSLGHNDRAMITAIKASLEEILKAAGSTEILSIEHRPGRSSHFLGTCRMGANPQSSVVNEWGRTHDISNLFIADGSIFITGAAVNPALTISALATRIAVGIIDALKRGNL